MTVAASSSVHPHVSPPPPPTSPFLAAPALNPLPTVFLPSTESPWSDLFNTRKSASLINTRLKRFAPIIQNGVAVVPSSIIDQGIQLWEDYLVGFFVEKKMPFFMVKNALTKAWNLKGKFTITTDQDLYYFKFSSIEDKNQVLEGGPVFIGGRFFIIRQWSKEVEKQKNKIKSIPVWAKIYNLPKELWTEQGLGFVASLIGEPICADEASIRQERLSFAKVCVEVNTLHKFDKFIKLKMGEDEYVTLEIDYPWTPSMCSVCNSIGHKIAKCPRAHKAVWVPKNIIHQQQSTPVVDRGQTSCVRDENGIPIQQARAVQPTVRSENWTRASGRNSNIPNGYLVSSPGRKAPSPNRFEMLASIEEGEILEETEVCSDEDGVEEREEGYNEECSNAEVGFEDFTNLQLDLNSSPQKVQSSVEVSHVSHTSYSGDNEETSHYTQDRTDYEANSSDEEIEDSEPIEEPSFFNDHIEPRSTSESTEKSVSRRVSRAERRKQIQDELRADQLDQFAFDKALPNRKKKKGRIQKERPERSGRKKSKSSNDRAR